MAMPDVLNHDMFEGGRLEVPHNTQVPQYSPLKYPGGKCKHTPIARLWLQSLDADTLVEPFAGGAHVGITAGVEGWVDEVVLVELDADVVAVWETVLGGDAEWLADRFQQFEPTEESVRQLLERRGESQRVRALSTLVRSRVSFGGMIHDVGGSYKADLTHKYCRGAVVERIRRLSCLQDCFEVVHDDGLDIMAGQAEQGDTAFFVDPPYPQEGGNLYKHSDVEHERVFQLCSDASERSLLTYDTTDVVQNLADKYGLNRRRLANENGRRGDTGEFLISSDMGWL
jgi:DNA adenine methylase